MRTKCFIILFGAFFSSYGIFSQTESQTNKAKFLRVAADNGFINGQEYSLKKIKTEFPDLGNQVLQAEIQFILSLGKAKEGIVKYLRD